jgi:hypothetical protein
LPLLFPYLGAFRMHKIFRSRVVAVATGALVVVGLGTTSGYAAAQITTAQIANNTILAEDVAAEAIRSSEVLDGSLRQRDLSQSVQDQIAQPGPTGATGATGATGDSAYDSWLAQGNTGSESDFLASLKGLDGQDGTDGLNGESAFQIAVRSGYSGTEEEWLLSLHGKDGQNGLDGQNGQDGLNGQDGQNGASAYDLAVKNGFAGTEQEWLASLKGAQGEKGEPGDPATDVKGALSASGNSAGLVPIQKIGGTYSTNATQLFTVELPEAGTYLISANGFFDRINEGATGYEVPNTDTYLQLTVRGAGLGATCFTPAVSPKGFTETTCDASSVVTVAGPTTLTVRGFGYNEDRSGFGGAPNSATPQFSVFAQLNAVKVG